MPKTIAGFELSLQFARGDYPFLESKRWREFPGSLHARGADLSEFSIIYWKPLNEVVEVEWEANYQAIKQLLIKKDNSQYCREHVVYDPESGKDQIGILVRIPSSGTFDTRNRKYMNIAERILQKLEDADLIDDDIYHQILNERIREDWKELKPVLACLLRQLNIIMLDDHMYALYERIYVGSKKFPEKCFTKTAVVWYLTYHPSLQWDRGI